jgi:hypothetical protein
MKKTGAIDKRLEVPEIRCTSRHKFTENSGKIVDVTSLHRLNFQNHKTNRSHWKQKENIYHILELFLTKTHVKVRLYYFYSVIE